MPDDRPPEGDMGRYVILLIVPVIIGFLIAVAVVVARGLGQRIDARRALLEAKRPDAALPPADLAAREESSDVAHRRIA
jgi:hypothetical protein